jgi:hypothetical protein
MYRKDIEMQDIFYGEIYGLRTRISPGREKMEYFIKMIYIFFIIFILGSYPLYITIYLFTFYLTSYFSLSYLLYYTHSHSYPHTIPYYTTNYHHTILPTTTLYLLPPHQPNPYQQPPWSYQQSW